ncbi:hypothetical protein CAOG_05912 [Capsaspora owczarzaki ATCC 30864]|uniref:Exostosin GT47 domain-containing protein n=1 Tax=Capsaspora owczarzaki (strain ATCC 30864) TaxID=595528 RepID=A0A0D2WUA1_CAPO3|nr:hypothetical protein CAOG_05912 [Capsaspora owczarzaki ATCC 30864]KJE95463.1 hypothetical protein CAOG_005912 [Capsaspora owczarzaki ATCC 30864]|eukprot:XP_004345502.1 hypothetical protein CAOG_05912 [Capsaspora owczarzaki ATCC 30864]
MQSKVWKRPLPIVVAVLVVLLVMRLTSTVSWESTLAGFSGQQHDDDDNDELGSEGELFDERCSPVKGGVPVHPKSQSDTNAAAAAALAAEIAAVPFQCMPSTLSSHLLDAPVGVLRIYVYKELLPSGDLLRDHCTAAGASAEVHFAKRPEEKYFLDWLATSKHATSNPNEAHFFIIPTPIECLFRITDDASLPALEVVQNVLNNHNYSIRAGHDHVLFTSSMAERAQTEVFHGASEQKYYSPVAVHFPNVILMSTESMYTQWFRPPRDIVIPPALNVDDYLDVLASSESEESFNEDRPQLCSYVGDFNSSAERKSIGDSATLRAKYTPVVTITDAVTAPAEVAAIYRQSSYCLAAQDETPSTMQMYEIMAAGCIPVLLTRNYLLPFPNHIDWELLIVRWLDEDIKGISIYIHLENLPRAHLVERRFLVRRARSLLTYGVERPSPPVAAFTHEDPHVRRRAYYTGPSGMIVRELADRFCRKYLL